MNTEKIPSPVTDKLIKTDNNNKNYILFKSVEMLLNFFFIIHCFRILVFSKNRLIFLKTRPINDL